MKEAANVEYFFQRCNALLGTSYAASNWGGDEVAKMAINLEWLAAAVAKVYEDVHGPKAQCRLLLSSRFNPNSSKISLTKEVVNSVVDYLSKLNKQPRPKGLNLTHRLL